MRILVQDSGGIDRPTDLLIAATPEVPPRPPILSCYWQHTLQFMNDMNDPRLRSKFPQIYAKYGSNGDKLVQALAEQGYFYAAEGGGGHDWVMDVGAWGVPQNGSLNKEINLVSLNSNSSDFSFDAWRTSDRQLTVKAYSKKRGEITQMRAEISFTQVGTCPPVPQ